MTPEDWLARIKRMTQKTDRTQQDNARQIGLLRKEAASLLRTAQMRQDRISELQGGK
jgi:hypothetical protein